MWCGVKERVPFSVSGATLAATAICRDFWVGLLCPIEWVGKADLNNVIHPWSGIAVTYSLASPTLSDLQSEVARLSEELQMRDNLVQQLSQELFRLVKSNPSATPDPQVSERQQAEVRALREQLQSVEQQVSFYQEQISDRDAEIYQLKQSVQELSDRSRMLEQVVEEMPKIYRQKFAERMAAVKEKVAQVQQENRRLHAELQSVSYRLAVRTRRQSHLDLPSFPRPGGAISLPSFG
jgi:predicted nuclease with TOPRIM domain